ncbi:EAL domain-containing protein [Lacipirellula limnantheis]|uniref:Cyclic-di-GMP phosphodiesterase AdrB n=1 Tax=Lacipirellula limnantheis TaxID=2528024 RepID=A0A517TT31_9BACT|nr:EAL domain-containing protein [Lacipirellula limnantheis]QDT71531.1 Putative cyclic-di-GMP phosphodiesterase AdrB [Lacipirellula limnantheis]
MSLSTFSSTNEATWALTGQLGADQAARSVAIDGSPFVIGRGTNASLSVVSPTVSGSHVELRMETGGLWARDLGSTNGTFVNGIRIIGEAELRPGDLLQIAEIVLRVGVQRGQVDCKTIADDSTDQALAMIQFDKLIAERAVLPHYQPIVETSTRETVGFEVLARSVLFGLGTPHAMFSAASLLDLEGELSRLLRDEGVRLAAALPANPLVFLNTHPAELQDQAQLECSLRELRRAFPSTALVLEIHEAAATSVNQMRSLRGVLNELEMQLAYDDFGAGQARLAELGDCPPDYLKFDIQLVRGIDSASLERQRMLGSLVRIAADLGIVSLAEGIETAEEHRVCRRLGFVYGQGFYYGTPAAAATFQTEASRVTPCATICPRLGDMYS